MKSGEVAVNKMRGTAVIRQGGGACPVVGGSAAPTPGK
uniref:Uncharacterized protein simX3 n=1 Tax=Streptomyces antibioticus TaxID=1890 RepID=G9VYV5_STRAT|nr:hypothetical protein [Streptomyces antibioticus]